MGNAQFFLREANVLIIGDFSPNVKILTSILKQNEFNNIRQVSNGELALEYAKEYLPDVILIYANIFEVDGFEICQSFKRCEGFKEVPIIFFNEDRDDIIKEKIFVSGGSDYLTMPFNCEEVIARIETHLKLRFMQFELKKSNDNQDIMKEQILSLKNEISNIKITEMDLGRKLDEYKKSYDHLIKVNNELENKVIEGVQQLEEITSELKEFNIILEEEITERTKTEEALKESERQFRYSLEESPLPIMLYTEDGEVRKINRTWCDITGYTIRDVPTISKWAEISDVFTEDLKDANLRNLFNLEKRQYDGEYSIKARSGNIRIWNFYSAYIGKLQDGHRLLMKVAIDITERKHMEELQKSVEEERQKLYEIKEYDRIKTEFFSNISHELRTPINVIFSAVQIHELTLKNCTFEDSSIDRYKYTQIMKQNCYRLLRLVNNIIDITKIDSGYFDINEQDVNVVTLVENITLSVADYIENKGLSLIFDTSVEEKIIACDSEKMERIILNLLSNAVKFTSNGGMIMVDIEDIGDEICIRIKDTGRGIPEDKLKSIFERFVQVDKTLTRDHEGSGIGLSLVKSLVELHGGTISVKSEINKGTEFIIHLPCKLISKTNDKITCSNSGNEDFIEKINLEFSDIYK